MSTEKKVGKFTLPTAKQIIEADNKVIIAGLAKGKKLPASVRKDIEETIALESEDDLKDTASSWSELAEIIGVARRTILRNRKKPDAPKSYKDVEAWIEFLNIDEKDPVIKSINAAKLRIYTIQGDERQHKLDVQKEKYVLHSEMIEVWTHCINIGISFLRNKFENELPPLFNLDPVHNMKLCRDVIDEYITMMHNGGKFTP